MVNPSKAMCIFLLIDEQPEEPSRDPSSDVIGGPDRLKSACKKKPGNRPTAKAGST
jgi:hypothetical protein